MITNHKLAEHSHRLGIPLITITNKDKIQQIPRQNGGMIINLQDDTDENGVDQPGSHWVGMWMENKKAVFFDPFGFPPPVQVEWWLKPYRPWTYSHKQIQNPRSEVCGYYCLYFLYFMTKHKGDPYKRFEKFMDLWSEDYEKNKTRLEKYLKPL